MPIFDKNYYPFSAMLKKTLVILMTVSVVLILLHSCNPMGGLPVAASQAETDTVLTEEIETYPAGRDSIALMDLWDSLQRDRMVFPAMDSTNSLDPKLAKSQMRDSIITELNKQDKHIYLTFDDGPLIGSAHIDSIITAKNVKISTFLIGKHAQMSKKLKRDFQRYMDNPLVACYNHSYTHAGNRFQAFYSNPDSALADFDKCETDLGLTDKIVRMPGRNIWMFDDVRRVDLTSDGQAADLLAVNGYRIYGWDVEWRINGLTGNSIQSVEEIYTRINNRLGNKSTLKPNNIVLLMHDDMFRSKKGQEQLSVLIGLLQRHQDYKFEFIGDYPIKY